MPKITADIPSSLNSALNNEAARTNTGTSSVVTAALAQYLKTPVHTLFQVSTSGAVSDFRKNLLNIRKAVKDVGQKPVSLLRQHAGQSDCAA